LATAAAMTQTERTCSISNQVRIVSEKGQNVVRRRLKYDLHNMSIVAAWSKKYHGVSIAHQREKEGFWPTRDACTGMREGLVRP
jgi:hypothetical protein